MSFSRRGSWKRRGDWTFWVSSWRVRRLKNTKLFKNWRIRKESRQFRCKNWRRLWNSRKTMNLQRRNMNLNSNSFSSRGNIWWRLWLTRKIKNLVGLLRVKVNGRAVSRCRSRILARKYAGSNESKNSLSSSKLSMIISIKTSWGMCRDHQLKSSDFLGNTEVRSSLDKVLKIIHLIMKWEPQQTNRLLSMEVVAGVQWHQICRKRLFCWINRMQGIIWVKNDDNLLIVSSPMVDIKLLIKYDV